ncbi:MAG: bifunctional glutamate N-acetyltransferase/amino-acid acetyltransferase ArgJ [Thermoleophilia bacterium]|nr:bifunctional glutamate N-acetyltransferase/amino-acid acetyltransferase ArgJ [Thermoleophilia bacterium]
MSKAKIHTKSQGELFHPIVSAPHLSRFWSLPEGVKLVETGGVSPGITYPKGFLASGVSAGLKESGKPDVGVVTVAPAFRELVSSGAVFTPNAFAAAPIVVTRDACQTGQLRAVVMNSGNANACTGQQGVLVADAMRQAGAEELGLDPTQVAIASTGIIGVQLNRDRAVAGVRKAARNVREDGGPEFSVAIMTTDRFPKACALEVETEEGTVRVAACAKGAGMISPAMATMLCVATSDALLTPHEAQALFAQAVARTFNRITVDGQMSTNDCAIFLASGASGIHPTGESLKRLGDALEAVLLRLALMMVADGEGSTKIMRLKVTGAGTAAEAERTARAVADSPLVKTAMHGCDPNWGRVMAAAGAAMAGRVLPRAALWLCGIKVVADAEACPLSAEEQGVLVERMKEPEIDLILDLGVGEHSSKVYFADLGHEYVNINAEYHT